MSDLYFFILLTGCLNLQNEFILFFSAYLSYQKSLDRAVFLYFSFIPCFPKVVVLYLAVSFFYVGFYLVI